MQQKRRARYPDLVGAPAKRKNGRPVFEFTPKLTKALCKTIREKFCTIEEALGVHGVAPSVFFRHLQLSREAPGGSPRREFSELIDKARHDSKVDVINLIRVSALDDWKAGAWLLERRFPREFGPRVRIHVEAELGEMLDRIEVAFASEPETLNRVLIALSGPTASRQAVQGEFVAGEDTSASTVDSEVVSGVPEPEAPDASD